MRVERRLETPRWLLVAVPIGSLLVAFAAMAVVLVATGHDRALPTDGFSTRHSSRTARSPRRSSFHAARVHRPRRRRGVRMQLYNIGGEASSTSAPWPPRHRPVPWVTLGVGSTVVSVVVMCLAARSPAGSGRPSRRAACLRADERDHHLAHAQLRRRARPHLPDHRQPLVLADTESFEGQTFPSARRCPSTRSGPPRPSDSRRETWSCRSASCWPIALAVVMWVVYRRTRFGFELQVIGDSPRAARYAGRRLRRKILVVMCLSGAIAGLGGASQEGDFAHQLDPTGLQSSFYGYRASSSRPWPATTPGRRAGRRADRRPPERGVHAPGRRLPVRARRRM